MPVKVRATFVNNLGEGIVRDVCLPAHSRATVWAANYPELAAEFWWFDAYYDYWEEGQVFATFFESVTTSDPACPSTSGTGFVAERAMYYGAGFTGGHVNVGTPWTGAISAPSRGMRPPPEAQVPGCTYSVSPTSLTFPATFTTTSEATVTVTVTTTAGCRWQAMTYGPSQLTWFIAEGAGNGSGTATVRVFGVNTKTTPLTGTVKIAGQLVAATQRAR